MRAARTTAAVLLAGSVAALTAFGAPTAFADSDIASFGFSVTPGTVAPGGSVTLRATDCDSQATASEPDLFNDAILGEGEGPGQSAAVSVRADATPGTRYDVTVMCGSEKGTAPLRLTVGMPAATPTTPVGAMRTGLGGGVSGPNSIEIIAGAALIGAAGVYVLCRRASRH
jgi:hypothetical protein